MAESGRTPQARALLQQCLHARLQVRPAEGDAAAQWVEVTSAPQLLLSSGAQGPFVLQCLSDLFPSVFLRARHVAPSACRGRCGTSGGSGQGAYSGLPGFACLLIPAPPAPAFSPSDLFLHRRIVFPT